MQAMNGKKRLGLTRWSMLLVLAAFFIGAAALIPVEAPAFPLESARLYENQGEAVLRIQTSDPAGQIPHEVFCLENPYRVVVDIFGADAPLDLEAPANGLVTEVRTSIWKDDPTHRIVRYVLETELPVEYHADATQDGLRIALSRKGEDTPSFSAEASSSAILHAVSVNHANDDIDRNEGPAQVGGGLQEWLYSPEEPLDGERPMIPAEPVADVLDDQLPMTETVPSVSLPMRVSVPGA